MINERKRFISRSIVTETTRTRPETAGIGRPPKPLQLKREPAAPALEEGRQLKRLLPTTSVSSLRKLCSLDEVSVQSCASLVSLRQGLGVASVRLSGAENALSHPHALVPAQSNPLGSFADSGKACCWGFSAQPRLPSHPPPRQMDAVCSLYTPHPRSPQANSPASHSVRTCVGDVVGSYRGCDGSGVGESQSSRRCTRPGTGCGIK